MTRILTGLMVAGVLAVGFGVVSQATASSALVSYVWYSYAHGPQYAYNVEEVSTPCETYFGVPDYLEPGYCFDESAPEGGHSTIEILD